MASNKNVKPTLQERTELFEPILLEIKQYLPVSQYECIKEYDEALFGVSYKTLGKYYLTAVNEYVRFKGQHYNRPWVSLVNKDNPIDYLLLKEDIDETFFSDAFLYLNQLRNSLTWFYEAYEEGISIGDLLEIVEQGARQLEKNYNRFVEETSKVENEKTFISVVGTFIHGGSLAINYFDIKDHKPATLNIELESNVWTRIKSDGRLSTFGEASDVNFAFYGQYLFYFYVLNEIINTALDYHDYSQDGFSWSVKETLLALDLIDQDTYNRMGK